jgi:hypothetical protein
MGRCHIAGGLPGTSCWRFGLVELPSDAAFGVKLAGVQTPRQMSGMGFCGLAVAPNKNGLSCLDEREPSATVQRMARASQRPAGCALNEVHCTRPRWRTGWLDCHSEVQKNAALGRLRCPHQAEAAVCRTVDPTDGVKEDGDCDSRGFTGSRMPLGFGTGVVGAGKHFEPVDGCDRRFLRRGGERGGRSPAAPARGVSFMGRISFVGGRERT